MALWDRIKAAREAADLGQEDVAREMGVSQPAVAQWELPPDRGGTAPARKRLSALAKLFGRTPAYFLEDGPVERAARAVGAPIPREQLVGTNPDMPVYASAEGGAAGAMVLSQDPVEWVKWPEPLWNVPTGFGVYVIGDSMEPAYHQGDRLLVHPGLPPARGQDALVGRMGEYGHISEALIKRLLNWDAISWHVRQFNPKKDYKLPRKEWPIALRVVGKYHAR